MDAANPSLTLHSKEENPELGRGFPSHSAHTNPRSGEEHPGHLSVQLPQESEELLQDDEGSPQFTDGNLKFSEWASKFGEDNLEINQRSFQISEGPQFSEESSQSHEHSFQFTREVTSKIHRRFSDGNSQLKGDSQKGEGRELQYSEGNLHSGEKSPQISEKISHSSQEGPHQNGKDTFQHIVESHRHSEQDEDEESSRSEEISPIREDSEGAIDVSRSEGLPSLEVFSSQEPKLLDGSALEESTEVVSWLEGPSGVKILKSGDPGVEDVSGSEGPLVEVSESQEPGVVEMARSEGHGVEVSRSKGPGYEYSRVEYFSQPPDIMAIPLQDQQETLFYPVISKEQPHKFSYHGNQEPIEVPSPTLQAREDVSINSDVPVYIPIHLREENGSMSIVREIEKNIQDILSKSFQDSQVPEEDEIEYDGIYTSDDTSEEMNHQDEGQGTGSDSHVNQDSVGEEATESQEGVRGESEVRHNDRKENASSQPQGKVGRNSRQLLEGEQRVSEHTQDEEERHIRRIQIEGEHRSRQIQENEDQVASETTHQEDRLEEVQKQDLDQAEGRERPEPEEVIVKEGRNYDQVSDEVHVQRGEKFEYGRVQNDASPERKGSHRVRASSQASQNPTDTSQRETSGDRRLSTSTSPRTHGRSRQQPVREDHVDTPSDNSRRGAVKFRGGSQRRQRGILVSGKTEELPLPRDQIATAEHQYGLKYTQEFSQSNATAGMKSRGEDTSREVHKREVSARGVSERDTRAIGKRARETSVRKVLGDRQVVSRRGSNAKETSVRRVMGEKQAVGERRSNSSGSSRVIPRQATSALMAALTLVGPLHP